MNKQDNFAEVFKAVRGRTWKDHRSRDLFTPGPYEPVLEMDGTLEIRTAYDGDADANGREIVTGGETIAYMADLDDAPFNADLLAASYELYMALSAICKEFAQNHPLILAGTAALVKARGSAA